MADVFEVCNFDWIMCYFLNPFAVFGFEEAMMYVTPKGSYGITGLYWLGVRHPPWLPSVPQEPFDPSMLAQ